MNLQNRYARQLLLPGFGTAAQQRLQQSGVLVIGAGGLGVPALQYLTGMGVGTIGIADGDLVSLGNLHRQVLYAETDVGKPKALVAAEKLSALNATVVLKPMVMEINPGNALEVMKDFDLIIDATDNFAARYLINDACVLLDKPYVYGAVHQYEGQVSVFNFQNGPTYRCLYPTPPSPGEIPDCNTAGVLGVVPGIVGCQQALEAVKLLTGVGKTLSGYVQIFDFLYNDQYKVKLKPRPESRSIRSLQESYGDATCSAVNSIPAGQLYEWIGAEKPFVLLDVREPAEYAQVHLNGARLVPLAELGGAIASLPRDQPWVTVCSKGVRSLKAAAEILEKDPGVQVYSMEGGMEQWLEQMGNKYTSA